MSPIIFSSQSVHWATPKGVYDALKEEFSFDFDPCPLGEFGIESDARGLFVSWARKRIFCNPPYNDIRAFLERAWEAEIAVFLIPARTDTRWFHEIVLPKAEEIRFIKGRLKFGGSANSAPFPSMVCIFKQ
jgi:hypothetical protein